MSDREHVLIAVPALDYTTSSAISLLFASSQQKSIMGGKYRFTVTTVDGIIGYDLVRNNIAKLFLDGPFDRLWMIDNDIVPREDTFGILDVDADIVAPLMPTFKYSFIEDKFEFSASYAAGDYDDINDLSTEKETLDIGNGGPIDVSMVGTGCIAIRRPVLKDSRMRYDESDLEEGDPPAIFRFHKKSNGGYKSGEDEDFCVRAKRLGYSVKLHTGIEVGHLRWSDISHIFKIKSHYAQVGVHSKAVSKVRPLSVAQAIL